MTEEGGGKKLLRLDILVVPSPPFTLLSMRHVHFPCG
jgi:hypothetical protein